ncbi:MAG: amidohydrolase family protein [Gemmatimonadota bacterium]
MEALSVVDAHVHFWDPAALSYPWLRTTPALDRPHRPRDYAAAHAGLPVEGCVFVEANARPDQNLDEARAVERLARAEPRIAAIVAFVDLTDRVGRSESLDRLAATPRVRGVRQNIQGHPPGFCLAAAFVEGVREVGRRGLPFDLCATHDQLDEVVALVHRCPDTRFVLDHCGKPAIREGRLEPWRGAIDRLAAYDTVRCKVSGLLTEAAPDRRGDAELLPYVEHVVERFGPARVMYGSDWPVVNLAGSGAEWYAFTRRFTRGWGADDTRRFYRDNAVRFYDLPVSTSADAAIGRRDSDRGKGHD